MTSIDIFAMSEKGREAPPAAHVAVTPNDNNDLEFITQALYIGGDGNVRVRSKDGDIVTYTGVKAGLYIVGQFDRVLATSTTATNIIAVGHGGSATSVGQGGANSFDPLTLSPSIWVSPSDLTTLRVERTGASATTQAVINGPVGSVRNKGTVGGWFIADADDRRPTLRSSGGFYWLEFDGNITTGQGDYLRLPSPGLSLVTLEMYLGARIIDWATGQGGLVTFSAGTVGQSAPDFNRVDALPFYINSTNYDVAVRAGPASSLIMNAGGLMRIPHVFELKKPNNSSAQIFVDGALAASDSAITDVFTTMAGDLLLGARQGNGIIAPGNAAIYELVVTNSVVAGDQLRGYVEGKTFGSVPKYPAITNTTQLSAARATLISEVFSTVGGVIPTDVATLELETTPPVSIVGAATCHRLVIPGYASRPRLWTPASPRDDVILFACSGHDVGINGNGLTGVVAQSALARGVRVVTFLLPGGPNELTAGDPAEHEAARAPLSEWVGPVSIVLNTLAATYPSANFHITGISGGGWMATMCGAVDTRFRGTYQFVGTLPDYVYINRDWEQRLPGITADYMTLYLLAACPSPRRHKHVLHENDPVGFNRAAYNSRPPWDAQIAAQAASIGGGFYSLVWDNFNQHAYRNPTFTDEVLNEIAP